MREHLRAGIAIHNAGSYHAAHDAWEERWLDCTGADERFLHGLIQFTATIHHARNRNWRGATGLAESAREYLAPLPSRYRGVDLTTVGEFLAVLGADPECIERASPPRLTHEGHDITLEDLDFPASAVAAAVVAEHGDYDTVMVERGIEYARTDLEDDNETSPFVTLVIDFARGENRGIVHQRLAEHTDRRAARERDVDGLFET